MITRRGFLKSVLATPAIVLVPNILLGKETLIETEKTNEFYLEVSARRSGKTTRLAKHMVDYITRTNEDVYLISPNYPMRSIVLDYIPETLHHKVLKPSTKMDTTLKMYFDEPGLISQDKHKLFSTRGYYAGTPNGKIFFNPRTRKFENNFLWDLVEWNHGNYMKYKPYHWIPDSNMHKLMSMEWKENLTYIQYQQEYLGEFI